MRRAIAAAVLAAAVWGTSPRVQAADPSTRPATTRAAAPKLRDDAPDAVKAIWAGREAIKAERVKALTADLTRQRAKLVRIQQAKITGNGGNSVRLPDTDRAEYSYASANGKTLAVAEQQAKVKAVEGELAAVRSAALVPPILKPAEMVGGGTIRVGSVGYVCLSKVSQVIDAENVVIEARTVAEWTTDAHLMDTSKVSVWLTGAATKGLTDDQQTATLVPLIVTGTKTYKTAGGSQQTILQAEVFKPDSYLVR